MLIPQLDTVAIGWPITRLGVSCFPVYLPANDLPAIATGDASKLVMDELDEAAVPTLRVRNLGDTPALVVEGEHFLGGKQNRALNATILVQARAELDIPVSCLEQGRWGHRQAYRRDGAFAAARVRSVQNAGVARSMRQTGSRDGDQAAVWSEINEMLSQASVGSPTAAAADMSRETCRREPPRTAVAEELAARGPLPRPVRHRDRPGASGHGHGPVRRAPSARRSLGCADSVVPPRLAPGQRPALRHAGAELRAALRLRAGTASAGRRAGRRTSHGSQETHRPGPDPRRGDRARDVLRDRFRVSRSAARRPLRAMAIVAESGPIPHPRTGSAGSARAARLPTSTAAALARSARNRLISATLT